MIKVNDLLTFLEQYAPYELAENWDNCGLLVGDKFDNVNKILCALDITQEVINEAINTNCNLIIAHHPMIFTSVNRIIFDDYTGKMIISAIKNNISIICMHTNLDSADFGVNYALATKLGLENIEVSENNMGRFGTLKNEMPFSEFLDFVKITLNANGLKYVGNNSVRKVAVLGGSGGKMMDFAIKNGCDTYITADCSYDVFQKSKALNLNLIDAGHFATENVICEILKDKICEKFGNILEISEIHSDIINFR